MANTKKLFSILTLLIVTFEAPQSLASNKEGEEIPEDESAAIEEIVGLIKSSVQAAAQKNGHAFRDAHRKHHGCVRAEFSVLPNLSKDLAQGIFSEAKTYSSWVRFSNGSGEAKDDHEGDGRGLAIKILSAPATERNLTEVSEETSSQDFLMINHPVFFVRNAADYIGFQKAVINGRVLFWILNPFRFFHEGKIARAIQGKKMFNPLEQRYWSMTPFKLGNQQMKFSAVPCENNSYVNLSDGADRLRENLESTLKEHDSCFLFKVQLRSSPETMPIEDPTIEWSEQDAPFTTVAKIKIFSQKPEQGEFCETLSFSPWNGLAAHRPLGGISRVRREVYEEISKLRHKINKQPREQPKE